MGFLKNRKKTSTQPVLHAENAKTRILQQTEGKTSQHLWEYSPAARMASTGG